ncbi:class I adenylate-forming enzyme family protein [Kitasatospora sp. NA04385]|uniref:class I adenylate-forming enzyme family protein n=1 Tax=Kitasatospora sp. NA04385 TaxID=2742135 RepID=UPI0026E0434C|nr:class I adenylate-forming enzyme family protein [Kitasatospora sp. NA04385]
MTWVSVAGVEFPDRVDRGLRAEWVARGWCPGRGLYELFAERVAADGRRVAVVDGDGELSYAELGRLVRGLAAGLAARGVRPGSVVGVKVPADRWAPAVDLAVAALGAVVLPCTPGHGRRDLLALWGTARVDAVVTVPEWKALVDGLRPELPDLHEVVVLDGTPWPERAEWVPTAVDPGAPARVLVSSGSEAAPKLVAYSHDALAGGRGRYVERVLETVDGGPARVLLLVHPATAYGSLAVVALVRCGAAVLLPPLGERFDPAAAVAAVGRWRPTHLAAVPTMLRRMAEVRPVPGEDLSSLQAVVSSAAALSPAVLAAALRRFGCPVVNVYGASDGLNCHARWVDPDGDVLRVGLPDPQVAEFRVCGPDGRPVPAGVPGELQALGPMTPLCHVGDPAADAALRVDGGWVRSGDRGVLEADGSLRVLARTRQTVNRGGVSISTAEVERLLEGHPEVLEAVCVPVPDQDLGERMCVCAVPRGAGLTLDGLTLFLAQACGLERYKLPERLLLLERLPVGGSGKPDRRVLAELAAAAGRSGGAVAAGEVVGAAG